MPALRLRVVDRVDQIQASEWDALLDSSATPFVRHAFLHALEESGCAAARNGWAPRHLLAYLSEGQGEGQLSGRVDGRSAGRGEVLVGAAPAYRKEDSDGDFSRDFDWASAAAEYRPSPTIATIPSTRS